MQAKFEKIPINEARPNHLRITELVKAAAEKCGGSRQLAETMDVHPQLVSNWKNAVKTPSPEAQAEMALIAGQDVLVTNLMATMEKTSGKRHERLSLAFKLWSQERKAFLDWKNTIGNATAQITSLYYSLGDRRQRPRFSTL